MKLSKRAGLAAFAVILIALAFGPAHGQMIWRSTYQFYPSQGYYDGDYVYYLMTDVSDSGYALTFGANYTPKLANALSPLLRDGSGEFMPSVYFVFNNDQRLVFSTEWHTVPPPYPPFLGDYMPLWRLQEVVWDPTETPVELTSVADIEFWETQIAPSGDPSIVVTDVGVVVGASIVINSRGEKIRQAFVSRKNGYPLVRLPLRQVFIDDDVYKILQLDFSNSYAAYLNKGNFVPLLAKFYKLRLWSQPTITQDIYSFWPRPPVRQLFVASERPTPFGPTNQNEDYSPMMNEMVFRLVGAAPFPLYTDADAIIATGWPITKTTYLAFQPVVAVTPPWEK